MLRFLWSRQTGLDDPLLIKRAESTRRVFCIGLSSHRDVQQIHSGGINTLDIDIVEKRYLLSGGSEGVIAIYDLNNTSGDVKFTYPCICTVGKSHRHVHKHSLLTVQWYPLDTGLFTSSGTDKLLKIWDTNTLVPADTFEFSGIVYSHHMSSIATQHNLLAVGCYGAKVKLVDMKSGSAIHELKGHRKTVYSLRWSTKDEFILATGSQDHRVLLWDIRSAKSYLMALDQHNGKKDKDSNKTNTSHNSTVNSVCFTSDGLHLASFGTDDRIHLWNTTSGCNTMVHYGKINNNTQKGVGICVSNDCQPDVLCVPHGANIDVFDLFSGSKLNVLRGHYNQVNCCVFDPDKQEIYSGGNDRNILVWQPETDTAYDDNLREQKLKSTISERGSISTANVNPVTADAWSSDED